MNKTIGFIGCGNMATAMIGGILQSKIIEVQNIYASDVSMDALNKIQEKYGIQIGTNQEVAKKGDFLVLSVKPQYYPQVCEAVKDLIHEQTVIIAIAAGLSLTYIQTLFTKPVKIIRAMPNTPALVLEGMTAICANEFVTRDELSEVQEIFTSFGKVESILESQFDVVTAISGSSPAYVFMMIEAMADGAVLGGLPRQQAYDFIAQAVLGSAKMLQQTKLHPGQLKDQVASPNGTTIEAIATLEEKGFRDALISAVKSCQLKSKQMTK